VVNRLKTAKRRFEEVCDLQSELKTGNDMTEALIDNSICKTQFQHLIMKFQTLQLQTLCILVKYIQEVIMEKLHCALQIRLAKKEIFFGPGVIQILKLTNQYESLNAASKEMNLSYSKAFKMIKGAEESLGFKLLDRKIGGPNGGGSTLTPECIEFLEKCNAFEVELNKISSDLFKKYFNDYI
ncbi:MAG: LysR family transcriptional regulator, partial [Mobilitalea sp.]